MDTLDRLMQANQKRAEEFNAVKFDLSFRGNEVAGEVGEMCNEIKKLERTRLGAVGGKTDMTGLREEIGDVIISTCLVAMDLGFDVKEIIVDKFNKTSKKHGFKTMME